MLDNGIYNLDMIYVYIYIQVLSWHYLDHETQYKNYDEIWLKEPTLRSNSGSVGSLRPRRTSEQRCSGCKESSSGTTFDNVMTATIRSQYGIDGQFFWLCSEDSDLVTLYKTRKHWCFRRKCLRCCALWGVAWLQGLQLWQTGRIFECAKFICHCF